jgi:hypothetical protein
MGGQIEKRCNAITHALTIIGELQGVLDFEKGGEPAQRLNSFYNITRAMVTRAGATSSKKELQELIEMYGRARGVGKSRVQRPCNRAGGTTPGVFGRESEGCSNGEGSG